SWSHDYVAAREEAPRLKKPLLVVLAPGKEGYDKIARDGLGDEVKALLADKYVCVAIDTATERGKELAREFVMPDGFGLVVSDRTGKAQAFRYQGALSNADLVRCLTRYADPNYVVFRTETNPQAGGYPYGAMAPGADYPYGATYPNGAMG